MKLSIPAGWRSNHLAGDFLFGTISSVLKISWGISMAALIFSGSLAPYLPNGIGIALIGASVLGLVVALGASLPGITAGPQSSTSVIIALIAASIAGKLSTAGDNDAVFPTVFVFIILSSLTVGLFLLFLGIFRLGKLIRFIPYPVVGGLLAGTGWLIFRGAFTTMLGNPLSLIEIGSLFLNKKIVLWMPGIIFALFLFFLHRRFKSMILMPFFIIAALGLFYFCLWLTGTSVADAISIGLLLKQFPESGIWQAPDLYFFQHTDWSAILNEIGGLLSIMFIAAFSLLLKATGLELETRKDFDLDHELIVAGVGNMIAGAAGGLVGLHSLGSSLLNYKTGANSRLVVVMSSVLCALALFCGASYLSYVPKPILGGLLLFVGISLLVEWGYDAIKKLQRLDYFLVILILLVIAAWGFIQGVAVGVLIAIILFVINASGINVARSELNGSVHSSNVERSVKQYNTLRNKGDHIFILRLHGFLFFGSAYSLLNKVQERIEASDRLKPKYIMIDFLLVTGLDSSVVFSFTKMRQLTKANKITLIFTGLKYDFLWQLEQGEFLDENSDDYFQTFPDIDRGLEWSEDQVLAGAGVENDHLSGFRDMLADIFPDISLTDIFIQFLSRMELSEGDVVYQQGDPSDDLCFIVQGRLSAITETKTGSNIRLLSMNAGAIVGEMGLYTGEPRSATVVAETDSILYFLSQHALDRINDNHPKIKLLFDNFIIRRLINRLNQKTSELKNLIQ
jgi:SulP family sulfate permease